MNIDLFNLIFFLKCTVVFLASWLPVFIAQKIISCFQVDVTDLD